MKGYIILFFVVFPSVFFKQTSLFFKFSKQDYSIGENFLFFPEFPYSRARIPRALSSCHGRCGIVVVIFSCVQKKISNNGECGGCASYDIPVSSMYKIAGKKNQQKKKKKKKPLLTRALYPLFPCFLPLFVLHI